MSTSPDERPASPLSRRTFLKSASVGAAASAAASVGAAKPLPLDIPNDQVKEQFLLDRITFGRTSRMVNQYRARGYTDFLKWQLQLPPFNTGTDKLDDSDMFNAGKPAQVENPESAYAWGLSPFDILGDTSEPCPQLGMDGLPLNDFKYCFPGTKMWSAAPQMLIHGGEFGNHQLRWVMTDFMQNVHNTYLLQPGGYIFWAPFLKNVIWENCLGIYSDLVKASAQGGSMLWYLGQPDSNASNPNENFARELMELHTVGVEDTVFPGLPPIETFKESDIAPVAAMLTGWDMVGWDILQGTETLTAQYGDFRFTPGDHVTGPMGQEVFNTVSMAGPWPPTTSKTYPTPGNEGLGEGEELIDDLCAHPTTALHISRRLVQWFLGDDYAGTFFNPWIRTAVAFINSGGNMKLTLLELFNETLFSEICPSTVSGCPALGQKVRRPNNVAIGLKRTMKAKINYQADKPFKWFSQMLRMGQINGYWPAPNGYQPQNEKWLGSLEPRVRFYYDSFFGDNVNGNGLQIATSTIDNIIPQGTAASAMAALAADHVYGGCLPSAEEARITDLLTDGHIPATEDLRRWAFFYVYTSPAHQFLC